MVDQLWIWVLGPQLVVTCFPQGWKHDRKRTTPLISSILEDLNPRSGRPVFSVHELVVRIAGQCLAACDRTAEHNGKLTYLDMFNSSVGTAMDKEVNTFKKFKAESDQAAQQLDRSLRDEHEHFVNIRAETFLLLEVKDIQDELGILSQVLDDQLSVLRSMSMVFGSVLINASEIDRRRVLDHAEDVKSTLKQQKAEIDSMTGQIQVIHTSISNSLEHRQRHASAIQACYAAMEAQHTTKAAKVMMIFTIVTVIFLPLSFLAAFFAINLDELPHNTSDEQQLPLAFVMKYIVGVGLATALSFVVIAWNWHKLFLWLQRQFAKLPSKLENIGFQPRKKESAKQCGNASSTSSGSLYTATSAFSLRARTKCKQIDLEAGQSGSSPACSIPD